MATSLAARSGAQQQPALPSDLPPQLVKEMQAEEVRRSEAETRMRRALPNQQIDARELDALSGDQMRTIVAELDRKTIAAARSGGSTLQSGLNRDRAELAWYSGRLTRDGLYPKESSIPEGKAVATYLVYYPAVGPYESWPPVFLPAFSSAIENGTLRNPAPMFFEMRVSAQVDGSMAFALLAAMGGKKILLPGTKVSSGEFAKVLVPGGHAIAIHATLRDQTLEEKERVKRMIAARAQSQQALDDERIAIRTTLLPGVDPSLAMPSGIVDRMRATAHRESARRALGALPS